MFRRILAGVLAAAVVGGVAYAQSAQPQPAPDNQSMQDGPNDEGQGWWGKRHGKGRGMHGMRAMMMQGTGFKLDLGKDITVAIKCGNEPMKDCIASAQPLIDAAKAAAAVKTQ